MIILENPIIEFNDNIPRKDGISAFMRIKNGEDYLKESILSIINQVDEIICVFNDSTDNTENILVELENLYPEKIKVFKYIPIVYPPNSENYLKTPENSVNSLAYYYNFALSKTTMSHIIKVDDDEIFFPNILRKLKSYNQTYGIRGVNLFDYDNNLYVNKNEEFTGGGDKILCKYSKNCRFQKYINCEKFIQPNKISKIILSFYHLKRCKKDRGINNYLLTTNQKSRYLNITINFFKNINLIKFDEYNKNKNLPSPLLLGFKFINDSKKEYKELLFEEYEKKIKI